MVDANSERGRHEAIVAPPLSIGEILSFTLDRLKPDSTILNEKNRDDVYASIHDNDILVIKAETGAGKSTAVPVLALAELEARKPGGRVVVTQPRRFAVEGLHEHLKKSMGGKVGFRHGKGNTTTKNTQLEFTIDQSLLNTMFKGDNPDRDLDKYGVVILDEIHERTAYTTVLMGILKQVQERRAAKEDPLKIILTSATLDKDLLSGYFPGAGHMEVEGRPFKVDINYATQNIDEDDVEVKAAQKASEIHAQGDEVPGDMLIFMPGKGEIENTIRELRKHKNLIDDDVEFVSLVGGDDNDDNVKKIYEVTNKRRIFVATNVAEASITIPTVRVVIDSGLMRTKVFNVDTGIDGLETRKTTKSNTTQRIGRAGRKAPGIAHLLYTKADLDSREEFLSAEIMRIDLAEVVLLMKKMGIEDIPSFDFLDNPGVARISQAIGTLGKLGALNSDGTLSEIGIQMTELNANPRLARMIVEARKLGCEDAVGLIVGLLQNDKNDYFDKTFQPDVSFQSKYAKFIVPGSDILTRLKIWNEFLLNNSSEDKLKRWGQENGLNTHAITKSISARKEVLQRTPSNDLIDLSPENVAKINRCVALGLIDSLVFKKGNGYQTLSGAVGIKIDRKKSVLAGTLPDTFIAGNLFRTDSGIIANMISEISIEDLVAAAPYLERILPRKEPDEMPVEGKDFVPTPGVVYKERRRAGELPEATFKVDLTKAPAVQEKENHGGHEKKKSRLRRWLRF